MAEKVTFLHTADLHIGAPFKGLRALSEKWSERLVCAIPEAFERLVDVALARQVDFMVAAGDIFDQAQPSYADYLVLHSGFSRLAEAGIDVYVCTGNHDPYTSWRSDYIDMPGNVHLFPATEPGFALFERDGAPLVLLGGRGFYNQVFDDDLDITDGITREAAEQALGTQAPFAIGVVHTGLDLDPTKAPANRQKMLSSGMDYWALGHIHLPWGNDADNPRLVFPGCIQGRSINETGPRGCAIVTLEEGKPNTLERVPLASVVWQMVDVDATECTTISQLQKLIMERLFALNGKAQCEEMVERITVSGTTPIHEALARPGVLAELRESVNGAHPHFFCDSLIDATKAPIDKQALLQEGLFPSVVMGASHDVCSALADASVYLESAFLDKGISLPSSVNDQVGQLAEQAEDLVLDLLGREGN